MKCHHLGDRDAIDQFFPYIIHVDTLLGYVRVFFFFSFFIQAGLIFHVYVFIFNVYPRQTPTQTQSDKQEFPFVGRMQTRAKSADVTQSSKKREKGKILAPIGRLNKRGFIQNKGK